MKICTSEDEYIKAIASAAQKACKRYGYLPSVLIGQSCLENGYGIRSYWDNPQIEALLAANNTVGIKSQLLNSSWSEYTVWQGKSITKNTPEEYSGRMVTIKDDFRVYDTIERSFCDFLLFLKFASNYGKGGVPKYGDEVLSIKDPEKLIKTVASRGYATGSTYPTSVMRIVRKHNLTKYDDLSKIVPSNYVPESLKLKYGMTASSVKNTNPTSSNIIQLSDRKINDITAENRGQVPASRGGNSIQFIVVHYLGVPNADNPYLYGGGYGGHYNIQRDGQIFKAANPKTAVVWHCGGGLQGSGGHQFHRICTNYNSIGIECGVCYTENVKDADGDSNKWYFTEETQESLVYLVSNLMDEYGISMDHVIRHYDVTGKICPNPYVKNNNLRTSWTWDQFKANLAQYRKNGTITVPDGSSSSGLSSSSTKSYIVKGDSGDEVKKLQTMLNACGYNCGTVDGDFGSKTDAAVRKLQADTDLTVDGMYGKNTKAVLEEMYKNVTAQKTAYTSDGAKVFLTAVKAVVDYAKANGWTYGNSTTTPPCADKKISCDRLIARAMYDLGYTDQPQGGFVCGNVINEHLLKWGFTKVTDKSKIKPGAVVAVKKKTQKYMNHVFVVKSYDPKTDKCDKFDMGSNTRIKTAQPFTNVKLVEWSDREFVCAWNVPENLKAKTTPKKYTSTTVYNGVDYSPVYNYSYYRKKYSDLQKAFGTDKDAYFKHFCQYGMQEGRKASSAFDVLKYKARYEDLRKAFGDNLPEYYKHYVIFGKKEGRKAL